MTFHFSRVEFWSATPAELVLLADAHIEAHRDPAERKTKGSAPVGGLLAGMFATAGKQGAP